MKTNAELGTLLKEPEKGIVAFFEGLPKNTVEISDGLVIVESQDQLDAFPHPTFRRLPWLREDTWLHPPVTWD